jgi:acylphosphatase
MGPELVRRRVVVHGRVQGVFFRGATVERARALGLSGWVRNRRDGCVEAVFEGSPEAVAEAVRFCHGGPPAAQVARVEAFDEIPEGVLGFGVERS